MSTEDPTLELRATATLISGEVIDSGVQIFPLSAFLDDPKTHINGNPLDVENAVQEMTDAVEYLAENWQDADSVSIETPERGLIRLNPAAIAYFSAYIKVVDDPICEYHNLPEFFGPDPFQSDVNNNQTPVWLCEQCARDSADEI